jgi:hypothetical protein
MILFRRYFGPDEPIFIELTRQRGRSIGRARNRAKRTP